MKKIWNSPWVNWWFLLIPMNLYVLLGRLSQGASLGKVQCSLVMVLCSVGLYLWESTQGKRASSQQKQD